ncbi:hypothetical protein BKA62DRAFT_190443 [Auriculariales sp. MPI-PUGE-AT-0066]|nr:hypothetical protein BKA62DRAFT_190443 [Auriculariales sp. MPI-PUGE-AT-0066]
MNSLDQQRLTTRFDNLLTEFCGNCTTLSELEDALFVMRSIFSDRIVLFSTRANAVRDPAARLPAELVAYILSFVDLNDLIAVTHVDSRWRAMAISIPSLWSDIQLSVNSCVVPYSGHRGNGWYHCVKDTPNYGWGTNLNRFIAQLERAAFAPINILLQFTSHADSALLEAIVKAISSRAASVRSLDIRTSPCTDWIYILGRVPVMPSLQSLTVSLAGKGIEEFDLGDFVSYDLGLWAFPALETLRLRGLTCHASHRNHMPHTLRRLETNMAIVGENLRRTLVHFPELEELQVEVPRIINSLSNETMEPTIHSLHHLHIESLTNEHLSWAYVQDVIKQLTTTSDGQSSSQKCPRVTFPLMIGATQTQNDGAHAILGGLSHASYFSVLANGTTTVMDEAVGVDRRAVPARQCVDVLDDFWGASLWCSLNSSQMRSAEIDLGLWERVGRDWYAPQLAELVLIVNSCHGVLPNLFLLPPMDEYSCPPRVSLPALKVVRFVRAMDATGITIGVNKLCVALDFANLIDKIVLDGLSIQGDLSRLERKARRLVFV